MPIDFKARMAQDDQALADLLEKRRAGIAGGIDQTRSEIEAGRGQAFGPVLQSRLAGLGVSGPVDTAPVTNRLGLSLDEALGTQKYGMERERVNLAYNRALDRARESGLNRQSAENFARQISQDEIRRQNEAAMGEKQRAQAIRKQGIENAATKRGEDLQLSSMPDPLDEYRAATMRIMTGMPTQLLTYYGLSGGFGGGGGNISTTPSAGGTAGPLTSGSGFSTGIDSMTGGRLYGQR
jgi:hypothetical protein